METDDLFGTVSTATNEFEFHCNLLSTTSTNSVGNTSNNNHNNNNNNNQSNINNVTVSSNDLNSTTGHPNAATQYLSNVLSNDLQLCNTTSTATKLMNNSICRQVSEQSLPSQSQFENSIENNINNNNNNSNTNNNNDTERNNFIICELSTNSANLNPVTHTETNPDIGNYTKTPTVSMASIQQYKNTSNQKGQNHPVSQSVPKPAPPLQTNVSSLVTKSRFHLLIWII